MSATQMSVQDQISALAGAVSNLQARLSQQGREGAYAPSSNDPYVVPGPRDFYSYTQRAAIAGAVGTTVPLVYQIEADSYFYMNALSFQADSALAALTDSTNVVPLLTIVILDSGSGRQLMANPTPINCIAGYNGNPFRLPKPRRFAPTSQITVTVVNYSANAYNLSFTLSGFKVYAQQAIAVNGPVGTGS
jgi:hypothetical protein